MESPINVGDTTTNSILHRLNDTHLDTACVSSICSVAYSGHNVVQLNLKLTKTGLKMDSEIYILRRAQDSFINVNQLLSILLKLNYFTGDQLDSFLNNEILTNSQYVDGNNSHVYNDWRKHENTFLRGIWIPYDKAVSLALKFDIYEFTKKLFLVDVHDYDKIPKASKRLFEEEEKSANNASLMGSPTKKPKIFKDESKDSIDEMDLVRTLAMQNPNLPYTLPPVTNMTNNEDTNVEVKQVFGDMFKKDEEGSLTFSDIKQAFLKYINNPDFTIIDIPLDQNGQTALHFAATLASPNLVSSFIKLNLNSPIRGNYKGESPLISTIVVTNSMEKGNFVELLKNYLFPDLWLYSNNNWSFLHYLASQADKNFASSKFYVTKILEYISPREKDLVELTSKLINLQDKDNGNTCLHIAAENESKWFIKLFLTLKADANIPNKVGIKPIDYYIVKDLINNTNASDNDQLFEVIKSSLEFLDKRVEVSEGIEKMDESNSQKQSEMVETTYNNNSNKIFKSIQDLLANTNHEYESIINSKVQQIKELHQSLHNSTIVTANNRFMSRKIGEKLLELDNLKLQIANITDKLQISEKELENSSNEDIHEDVNADDAFIINKLHDRIANGEPYDDLAADEEFINSLPSAGVLQARIRAYKEINDSLEEELKSLVNYSELTFKFKKVVSICTGVDINEVDELLDGLLEAVEGQQ